MRRSWSWLLVLVPALAILAGAGCGRAPAPGDASSSVSRHAPPAERIPDREALPGSHFRLGRGVATGAMVRRTPATVSVDPALPDSPRTLPPLPAPTARTSFEVDRSLRDGTRSSRSTGLPPPGS